MRYSDMRRLLHPPDRRAQQPWYQHLGHLGISLIELNGRIYQVFSALVYLAAPTTPVRRGADSSHMDAHTFLATTESNLVYVWIPRT
eukprot:128525-Pyramimonas_sp.AAC.1